MDLIHRLPKAALVTVVALLFFGGTVGVVVAAGSEPLPETFRVAEPQVGDRWEYSADIVVTYRGESERDTESDFTGFEWLESDMVYDRDGVPRHVQPLRDVRNDVTGYVDMDSKRVVAQAYDYPVREYGSTSMSVMGVPIAPLTQGGESSGNVSIVGYFDEPSPCGFFTDLQGQNHTLDEPVRIHGGCLGLDPSQEDALFEATSVQTFDGAPAVGFEATDGTNTTRIWYNPNIPYPVRMEMDLVTGLAALLGIDEQTLEEEGVFDDIPDEVELGIELTMIGFAPGSAPWGVPAGPLPPALTAVETAPVGALGPDDSGIDHPFLLSEAFQGAMADPLYTNLRDYMGRHPDARIVRAENEATVDGDYDVHTWWFLVWDEGETLEVEAERRIAHEGTPQQTVEGLSGPQETYQDEEAGGFSGFFDFTMVDERLLPETAPRVVSAMLRFEEATGAPANTYGFDYTCEWFCWLGRPDALAVGSDVVTGEPADIVTGEPGRTESVHHFFRFDQGGHLTLEERTETQGSTWTAGLLGTSGATPARYTAPDDISTPPAAIWQAPPAEAAAGITFVAFLIGLGYWLWPSLKTLPFFGLFSRVRADRLLDNQVRAAIYRTIQESPGIHYQELTRVLGKGASVVEHHIRKLDHGGYITVQKGSGFTCFFATGTVDRRVMAAVPALKTDGATKVLREVMDHPGASISDVARRIGVSKSTVSYHVGRLRKAHLLEDSRALTPTEEAQSALVYAA